MKSLTKTRYCHTFPLVIHYLVLHFSEVWKCGILPRVSPSHEPFAIPYLVLHFPQVQKCEESDKDKILSHFSASHESFVILYLVQSTLLRGVEVWNIVTLFP